MIYIFMCIKICQLHTLVCFSTNNTLYFHMHGTMQIAHTYIKSKHVLVLMIPCKFCQQTGVHSWQLGLCAQTPCWPGSPCLQLFAGRTPTEAEADLRVPALRACRTKIISNILLQLYVMILNSQILTLASAL